MNEFTTLDPTPSNEMPDIAQSDTASHETTLDWVGMSNISLPLQVPVLQTDLSTSSQTVNAAVACFVNLKDPKTKGIHMSRLYLLLTQFTEDEVISPSGLGVFAKRMLASHEDISDRAKITFKFPLLLKRPALKSQFSGWKSYPCEIEIRLVDGDIQILSTVSIDYSSTCPCSAALARQLVQQAFSEDFAGEATPSKQSVEAWLRSPKGSYATPHSQRSEAFVQFRLDPTATLFQFVEVINHIEKSLSTPVQTAVKREDEQEFAKLNGHNLMFCEDAARRIHHCLEHLGFPDFKAKVSHFESLHAHDAVSMTSKNIQSGLSW